MAAPEFKELVTADVMRMVEGTPFAHIRHTRDTMSTNDDASLIMGKPEALGLTIVAEHQRKGAGRKGRAWLDVPRAGLLFTTVLPEPFPSDSLWAVPFWAALCVRMAVTKRYNKPLALQWPNDLYLGEKKVGGILSTSRVRAAEALVAIGIGLNVHRPADKKAYAAIDPQPAFLGDDISGVRREHVLGDILLTFAAQMKLLSTPRMIALRWEIAAALAGTKYRVALDSGEKVEGTAERLAPDGALILRVNDEERTVHFADARVLT